MVVDNDQMTNAFGQRTQGIKELVEPAPVVPIDDNRRKTHACEKFNTAFTQIQ